MMELHSSMVTRLIIIGGSGTGVAAREMVFVGTVDVNVNNHHLQVPAGHTKVVSVPSLEEVTVVVLRQVSYVRQRIWWAPWLHRLVAVAYWSTGTRDWEPEMLL